APWPGPCGPAPPAVLSTTWMWWELLRWESADGVRRGPPPGPARVDDLERQLRGKCRPLLRSGRRRENHGRAVSRAVQRAAVASGCAVLRCLRDWRRGD